jgi:hypothetical protein
MSQSYSQEVGDFPHFIDTCSQVLDKHARVETTQWKEVIWHGRGTKQTDFFQKEYMPSQGKFLILKISPQIR